MSVAERRVGEDASMICITQSGGFLFKAVLDVNKRCKERGLLEYQSNK